VAAGALIIIVGVLLWALGGLLFGMGDQDEAWSVDGAADAISDLGNRISDAVGGLFDAGAAGTAERILVLEERVIGGVVVQGEEIFFVYVDDSFENGNFITSIVVERMDADGQNRQETALLWERDKIPWIHGFDVTEAGYFRIFIEERDWGAWDREEDEVVLTYFYIEFDAAGNVVHQWTLTEENYAADMRWVSGAVFTPDGDLVVDVFTEEDVFTNDERYLYIFGRDGTRRNTLSAVGEIARTSDGRIFMFAGHLWEIDVASAAFGEIVGGMYAWDMFSAPAHSPFDLYGNRHLAGTGTTRLYGYTFEPRERTLLFDWDEFGFIPQGFGHHLGFLADGRIALLRLHMDNDIGELQSWTEVFILTP